MKIVLASSNEHKVKEINEISLGEGIEFVLPHSGFAPVEDGKTFEENSLIKALEAWKLSKTWTLADDSGLCIDALGGKPGIYSARYAETPQKRIERVLKEMDGVENRKAHFSCCMTLINPEGKVEFSYTGRCDGSIAYRAVGNNGFGYDPIFLVENSGKTMAELSDSEKNHVSHRFRALRQILRYINESHLAESV